MSSISDSSSPPATGGTLEQISDSDGREAISSDDEVKKTNDLETVSDDDDLDLTSPKKPGLDDLVDHDELDYDDEPQPPLPAAAIVPAPVLDEGRDDVSSDEGGLDEMRSPVRAPEKEGSEDGEVVESGDGSEDGEIAEDDDPYNRRSYQSNLSTVPCKFYMRGMCSYGDSCKFMHGGQPEIPGINLRDLRRRYEGSPEPEKAPTPPPVPKVETAWERGLRQAKELLKKTKVRREAEPDLKEKRMTLSLNDISPERPEKHPYYDQSDDELVRYSDEDMTVAEARQSWHGGHYENFEIRYTRESEYSPERSGPGGRRPMPIDSPPVKVRADEWRDPWMRSGSPKDKRRRSPSPVRARRRRYSSSGSSSYSSSSRSSSRSSSSSSSRSSHRGRPLPYPKRRTDRRRPEPRESGGRPLDIPRRPAEGPFSKKHLSQATVKRGERVDRRDNRRDSHKEQKPLVKEPVKEPPKKPREKEMGRDRDVVRERDGREKESKDTRREEPRRVDSPPPPPPGKRTKPKQIGPSKADFKGAKMEKSRMEAEKVEQAKKAIKPAAPKPVQRKPPPPAKAAERPQARKRARSSDSDSSLSSVTSSSSSDSDRPRRREKIRKPASPRMKPPPPKAVRPEKPTKPQPKDQRDPKRSAKPPQKPVQYVKPLPKTPESPIKETAVKLNRKEEPAKRREEPKKPALDDPKRSGIKLTLVKKHGERNLKRPADNPIADVKKPVKEDVKPPVSKKPAPVPKKPEEKKQEKKKSAGNRREELLKQLKAVEDAIARKRSKIA